MAFKPAENQQAFLKMGVYGTAGSGKTFTSAEIAKGIWKRTKDAKPVYFLDTETGSDFLVKPFKDAGIPLFSDKTRAFVELIDGIQSAEKEASVLIIDSISHFWEELQSAFKKKVNRQRLTIGDWGVIKEQWRIFTDLYLNSCVHIIICGRSRDISDWETGDDGKKELVKVGTTMKTEKDMAYEPSFLVEMVKEYENDGRTSGKLWKHTAYILKDRSSLLEGKVFENPTFSNFEPYFNYLNIGGEHLSIDTSRESSEVFSEGNDDNWAYVKKQKEIVLEEIEGELTARYPGQGKEEKKIKADIVFNVFNTRSWTKVGDLSLEALRNGLQQIIKMEVKNVAAA